MAADRTQDLKNRLQSLSAEQLTGLRQSLSYRLIQAQLKGLGWLNVFLGLLTVWLALLPSEYTLFKIIQFIIGLSTVVASLWSIIAPRPSGLRMWGVLLSVAAVWNLFIGLIPFGINWFPIALALFQAWGVFSMYRNFQKNPPQASINSDAVRRNDELATGHQTKVRWMNGREGVMKGET
ncbi:MAG: hypothetical protein JNM70_23410, partial [Anaerolineae bacterium]|nr:hypothetical protein [Anaerolineae bacterium]